MIFQESTDSAREQQADNMVTQFTESKITNEIWNYLDSRFSKDLINYIIDSKYRVSRNLVEWLREQYPADLKIPDLKGTTNDGTIMNILRYTRANIDYRTDSKVWAMNEYWQQYSGTRDKHTGDCEDGAIFMYCLARSSGIPANRLMILAGDVTDPNNSNKTIGHCWLGYRSEGNPLTWEFIDWCYYYNANGIEYRPKYIINGKNITAGNGKYKKLWFAFNEEKSHSELIWDLKKSAEEIK